MAESVLLGGADVFQLVNDRAARAAGLAGNHSAFVVELGGRLEPARLEQRLARAALLLPELRFRLEGWLPWRRRWVAGERLAGPLLGVRVERERPTLEVVEALLDEPLPRDRAWGVELVRGEQCDAVVLRVAHTLLDAKGLGRLAQWLGRGADAAPEPPPPPSARHASAASALAGMARERRVELARAWAAHVTRIGETPILSPASARDRATALRGAGRPWTRIPRIRLSLDETRAFDRRVRARPGLSETSLLVLGAARAVDALLLARGFAPPQHLVPVPVSLDPKRDAARFFGNHLTMMMLVLTRAELADEARAAARLLEQQREIVRQRLDLGMIAALELARHLPDVAFRHFASKPTHGEIATFVLSNTGTIELPSFLGEPVFDAYAVPSVASPPGLLAIFSRFEGRLSCFLPHLSSAVSKTEAAELARVVRAELVPSSAHAGAATLAGRDSL